MVRRLAKIWFAILGEIKATAIEVGASSNFVAFDREWVSSSLVDNEKRCASHSKTNVRRCDFVWIKLFLENEMIKFVHENIINIVPVRVGGGARGLRRRKYFITSDACYVDCLTKINKVEWVPQQACTSSLWVWSSDSAEKEETIEIGRIKYFELISCLHRLILESSWKLVTCDQYAAGFWLSNYLVRGKVYLLRNFLCL